MKEEESVGSEQSFQGRVALVTGGTSGIGRATALALAARGADVAVNYARDDASARAVTAEIERLGHRCLAVKADATSAVAVADAVATTEEGLGSIDILVNNVGGVIRRTPFAECDELLWDQVQALNLKSAFLFTRTVLPGLLARGFGAVVNVSAFAARNGGAGNGSIHYGVAKAGLEALTVGLARDYADSGVRFNAVQVGLVDTPLHAHTTLHPKYGSPETFMARVSAATPMHRPARPEEIADAIVYLASDQASYVTGAVLAVAGGL